MAGPVSISRRRFLRQTATFSAAAALAGGVGGCGWGISKDQYDPGDGHMMMVGDWGADGDITNQRQVASAMQSVAAKHSLDLKALLLLGDNFYGPLSGVNSPRFQVQFEKMYPASTFNCPAYAIPGNHDYEVSPVAKYPLELQYAQNSGTRWTMPSQWYSFMFPLDNPVMKIVALDSNVPLPTTGGFYTMTPQQYADQLIFLEAELAAPRTVPFLVVIGHHPVYSDGPHGDHPVLVRDWDPLFRKYGVHLYIAGHDHDLQHLEFAGHPTSYFCSGAGGADLYNLKIPGSVRGPYAQKVFGFSHMHATQDLLTLRHIDGTGQTLHKFTKAVDGTVKVLI